MPSLETILHEQIREDGPLSIASFMDRALYDPNYGYYTTTFPIGKQGDFITAPEISQLFGDVLGAYLCAMWQALGSPSRVLLVECGPGRGTLMRDILRATSHAEAFQKAISCHMIETSPSLTSIQQKTLSHIKEIPIHWHQSLELLPTDAPILLVANEFLDAFPIEQYCLHHEVWHERRITSNPTATEFDFVECKTSHAQHAYLSSTYPRAKEGDIVELSPATQGWCNDLASRLEKQRGHACIIDYGHYIPANQRTAFISTLQAARKHTYSDVLKDVGKADLTAHVDFYAIGELFSSYTNLAVGGPWTQGDFLQSLHIHIRADRLMKNSPHPASIQHDLNRLISPAEMGELFKVLTVTAS